MISAKALKPGSQLGVYPQRLERGAGRFDRAMDAVAVRLRNLVRYRRYSISQLEQQVDRAGSELDKLDLAALQARLQDLRYRLHREGLQDALVFESFAMVRAVSAIVLGKRHYATQLLGGWSF